MTKKECNNHHVRTIRQVLECFGQKPISQTEIMRKSKVSYSSLYATLKYLQSHGLIEASREKHERCKNIMITIGGKKVREILKEYDL